MHLKALNNRLILNDPFLYRPVQKIGIFVPMRFFRFFSLILFILQVNIAFTQPAHRFANKSIVYYSSEDAGGFAQSWAITQGKNGLMYFGNGAGILEFDGTAWRLIPISNAVRTFSEDINGIVYCGGDNNIGYLKPDDQGKESYFSLIDSIPEKDRDFVAILSIFKKDGLVFFIGFKGIYIFKDNSFIKVIRPETDFRYAFNIRNKIFVRESGRGLVGVSPENVYDVPGGSFFADKPVYFMSETGENKVLIGTSENGLYTANLPLILEEKKPEFEITEFKTLANKFIIKNSLYHGCVLNNGDIALATTLGGVIVIGTDGTVKNIFNKNSGLKIANTSSVFQDNFGNIWVALQNGIAKIEYSNPLSFFPEETVIPGIINTSIEFNGLLYVGTMEGLYVLEENPRYIEEEIMYRSTKLNESYNSVMQLNVVNNELIASARFNICRVTGKTMREISNEEFGFVSYQYKKNPDLLFASNANGLIVFGFKNGKWKVLGQVEGISYGVRSINETSDGDLWLNSFQGKLPRLKFKSGDYLKPEIKWYESDKGLPSAPTVNVETSFEDLCFLANGRFYNYNSNTDRIEPDKTLPLLYLGDTIEYGNYCFFGRDLAFSSTNKGLMRIKLSEGKEPVADIIYPRGMPGQTYYMKPDSANNVVLFSVSSGLYVMNLDSVDSPKKEFRTAIRKIFTGKDSTVFDGVCTESIKDVISIPFEQNSLTVVFSSLYFEKQETNEYTYMLEGLDTSWTIWSKELKVNYPFLPVGTYTFKVKSRNHYNIESPVASFTIEILPPWYLTWWAYIIYALLSIVVVFIIIKGYSMRLKKANIHLEKTVKARTAEIEMQKNEIELKNVQLQIINKELEKLSIVARETDNSIMIMDSTGRFEWINDGFIRLNQYNLEKLINERANNILDYSTNPDIKEHFSECVNEKKTVIYESEVIRMDGSSFWAQTTLTPVLNSAGNVARVVAIDSDITRLKEVQDEVYKQKEEIEKTKEELEKINSELEKLSIVARETDNVVMIMDKDGVYEWMNEKSLKKMYGISLDELYAKKGRSLISSSYSGEIRKTWKKCIEEKKSVSYQALATNSKGRTFWTQCTLTPIIDADGNVVKVIGIDTDISKIKNAEEKIKQQSEELSKSFDELQKKNMLISQSIEYAEKIQKAILHNEEQLKEIYPESFVMLMPKDVVSGDFCWFYKQGRISVVVAADCTGHGVPGAFMSLIGSSILNEIVKEKGELDPAKILSLMNERIITVLRQNQQGENIQEDGMDVAVCRYDNGRDQLTFAGANMPLLLHNEDGVVKVHGDLFSIGGTFSTRKNVRFKNQVFNTGEFNGFFLYSDGFQDQYGGTEKKKFMADPFTGLLRDISSLTCKEQKETLSKAFSDWKGDEKQIDDVLVIGCLFSKNKI